MSSTPEAGRLTPELRTTGFYFTLFMANGAAVMALPLWLDSMGISAGEIGVINAVPMLMMLLVNLVIGKVADRAKDWRSVIIIGSLLAGVIPIGLFFVNEFWGILLVWTLAALPNSAVNPVVDAATMRMTRRRGTDYGTIRAWGTVGYMVLNAATGFLIASYGTAAFVPLFVGLCLLRAGTALGLPRFRSPAPQPTVAEAVPVAGRARELLKPWFVLPIFGFAMVFGTHFILNAFAALLWKEQGISESVIGPLIAIGAFAEAAMMFAWRHFSTRFSARHLIILSAVVAAARWVAMAFSPPVWVLVPLQLTHSVTFSLGFLASIHFITNWTSEDIAAEAQSYFVVLQQSMSVISLIGFGWLVGLMGPHAYLVAALFALAGGGCVWVSLRMRAPKPR
ncbi:putative 3-phenylpropionic acid transporter [Devosia sp. H5989]|nr:putative 3-phenylpropionic acid transporter [Devosia sp. H5989]